MTEVAFHFNAPDKAEYVCRLLRKALRARAKVVVCAQPPLLQELDTRLWTFAPLEFLPHCQRQADAPALQHSPVVLTEVLAPVETLPHHQILVNLGADVPAGYETFERVIEVVSHDPADRARARARWKHYADRGYPIVRLDLALKEAAA